MRLGHREADDGVEREEVPERVREFVNLRIDELLHTRGAPVNIAEDAYCASTLDP